MRFTDVIIVIPLLLIVAVVGVRASSASGVWTRGARARAVPVDRAGPARAGRVPGPARARVRRRGAGGRRVVRGGSSSSTSCPTRVGVDRRQHHAADGRRRSSPRRRSASSASASSSPDVSLGIARQRLPGGVLQPAVAVHLARRVHRRHRAVPAVHRRRSARRVRPAPEADPQAQGPRAADRRRRRAETGRTGTAARIDDVRPPAPTTAERDAGRAPAAIVPDVPAHRRRARARARGSSR